MKKFLILFLFAFILLLTNKTHALAIMAEPEIRQAQNYGLRNYQKSIPEFIKPWMAYEEGSKALDNNSERAYIYSPYYLVAINARERLLASQTINTSDGETVLQTFQNSLPFGVSLYLEDVTDLEKTLVANLIQDGKKIQSYAVRVQDINVVKTKKIQETVVVEKDKKEISATVFVKDKKDNNAGKDDKKSSDKSVNKENKEEKNNKELVNSEVNPIVEEETIVKETVVVEKTVPALYYVQLFVYFDIRMVNTHEPSTLSIELSDGQKHNFFFDLDAIN